MGGGGGGEPFYGACGQLKGPPEAKEPLCVEAKGSFTPRKMFAIGGKF